MEDNLIQDVLPLEKCKKLRILVLDGNMVKNVSVLGGLKKLEILSIGHNCVSGEGDLGDLLELPSLRLVYLDGNPILERDPGMFSLKLDRVVF